MLSDKLKRDTINRITQIPSIITTNQLKTLIMRRLLKIAVVIISITPTPIIYRAGRILDSTSMPIPPTAATAAKQATPPNSKVAAWGFCFENSLIHCSGSTCALLLSR
jgi:hypothetical protein